MRPETELIFKSKGNFSALSNNFFLFCRPPVPPFAVVMKPMELDVEVHSDCRSNAGNAQTGSNNYAAAGNGTNPIDNTPTNAEMSLLKKACDDQRGDDEDDLESLYPSVPLRTSSILPRPAMVCKVKSILDLRFIFEF